MALRGSRSALLLSLVLLGAWLALASGQRQKLTNDMFLRRHWDNPKTPVNGSNSPIMILPYPPPVSSAYCDLQTRARGIQGSNVFIHERIAVINSVCKRGGRPVRRNRRISRRRLSLTLCRSYPMGGGYMERKASRRIVVICRNKRPVRLVRTVSALPWV